MSPTRSPQGDTPRNRILRRCSRPEGAAAAQIGHCFRHDERDESRVVRDQLVAEGVLHRITQNSVGHSGQPPARYFTNLADGKVWQGCPRPKAAPKTAARNPKPLTISQPKARTTAPEGPVIVPPGLVVQRLPSAPVYSRHQLPPGERVVGGWASLGPGRYLEDARP